MQVKMKLPIDTDILRMKIQKDLENRHRVEIDQRIGEMEKVTDAYHEVKR